MAEAEGGPNIQSGRIAGPDTSVAHPARVYDYWLGGKDNFAADREAAERVLAAAPGLRFRVRANRAFLGRTTRYLAAEAGIRQFLDIGTGIPTGDNTHEVAQREAPGARVVYVDNDHCKSGCTHTYVAGVYLKEHGNEPWRTGLNCGDTDSTSRGYPKDFVIVTPPLLRADMSDTPGATLLDM